MYFSLAYLALMAATVYGQTLREDLSFGQSGRISADLNSVPNFNLLGNPYPLQILSNKIILTPVQPGNVRGAIWAQKPLNHLAWTVDLEFRATGPGRVGGNIQIWLVKDGQADVDTSSIYTVGLFDGFGLVLDSYGGYGGTLRGFLNDGLTNYKNHHSVDSLAFGHCTRPYRNLGRPSQVSIKQSKTNFQVLVDGDLCFESPNIRIPQGYYLGVSAASADEPDSFEVYKFVVTADDEGSGTPAPLDGGNAAEQLGTPSFLNVDKKPQTESGTYSQEDLPEQAAETIDQSKQFADLHYRLQAINKHLTSFQRDFLQFQREANHRQDELKASRVFPTDQLNGMDRRLEAMERNVQEIKSTILGSGNDYQKHMDEVKRAIGEGHSSILEGVVGSMTHMITGSAPRLGFFIFVVIGFQVLLALSYVIYKKRRGMMPKKYL